MGKQKKASRRSATKDLNDLRSVKSSLTKITHNVEFLRDSLIERPEDPDSRLTKIKILRQSYNRLFKEKVVLEKKFGVR